jgi:hypothetical protein
MLADSEDPAVIFYTVAAVAKLGLPQWNGALFTPPLHNFQLDFHLPGPAVASRLAKKASIAWAIDPTVLVRQFSDTKCSRSPLFET